MDYLSNLGVSFLDLFSPARGRRRETITAPQRRERRKHSPAAKERAYRIKKHYRERPWLPRQMEDRAIRDVTMTSEELEGEWKELSDECDTYSEQQQGHSGNLVSEDRGEGPASFDGPADPKDEQGQNRSQEGEEEERSSFEFDELGDTPVNDDEIRKDTERALMYQKIISEIDTEGWSNDELALYCRLRMRGREPMLPAHWKVDFETIPGRLFGDEKKVMINSHCQNTFHATQALHALFKLGGRVRDRELAGRPVESLVKKEIERYIRWSQHDGEFHRKPHIPVLAIVAANPGERETDLEKRIEKKLKTFASRYRESFSSQDGAGYIKTLPTFYGLIISGNMIGFVTYNSANENAPIRNIGLFDYSTHNNDVWNGIAISYLVIAARNNLIEILEDVDSESVETSDPDA